jgi:hypothetical protein
VNPVRAIDRYWMAPAPAARLGAVRLFVGIYAVVYLFGRLPHSLSYASFSRSHFRPVGVVDLLIDKPLPGWLVAGLAIACAAMAIPFALGLAFRLTGPVFAALILWVLTYNNSWGMIFHTENLLVMHVIVLACAASADAWAVDSRRVAAPADDARYGWPLRLMCWIVVIAYVIAGLAKLRNTGTSWIWGDDLRNYIAMDNARKLLLGDTASPIAAPLMELGSAFKLMALASVALELGAPIALLHRKLAALWAVAVWGFHASVLLLMWIFFPYQLLGFAYLPFFRAERLADWSARTLRRLRGRRGSEAAAHAEGGDQR